MNMESSQPGESVSQEAQEAISLKIRQALENAVSESRFSEIQEILGQDIQGLRNPSVDKKMLEAEILASTVVVETLPEYREVLKQVEVLINEEEGWAEKEATHENCHAIVGQKVGFEWLGFGLFMVKDDEGNLAGVNPHCVMNPREEWSEGEYHSKSIEMLQAPEVYGEQLSQGDIEQIEMHRNSLVKDGDLKKEDI